MDVLCVSNWIRIVCMLHRCVAPAWIMHENEQNVSDWKLSTIECPMKNHCNLNQIASNYNCDCTPFNLANCYCCCCFCCVSNMHIAQCTSKQMLYHCVKSQWTVLSFNCVCVRFTYHLLTTHHCKMCTHAPGTYVFMYPQRNNRYRSFIRYCTFHLCSNKKNVLIHRNVSICIDKFLNCTDALSTFVY